MQIRVSKYKLYIILYHLLFMGHVINSNIIHKGFILLFLIMVSLYEIPILIKHSRYFLYMGTLAILSALMIYIRGFYNNGTLAIYFFFMPIIVLSYKEKHIGHNVQLIPLILFLTFIIIQGLRGADFNYILDNQSRNMVSFYYLLYTVYYYIERYRYFNKIEIWPALLSLIVSFLTIGRAGIISSALLFGLILIFKNKSSNNVKRIKLFVNSLFVLLVMIALKDFFLGFIDNSLLRINEMGLSSGPRELIGNAYIYAMMSNCKDFFLGVSLTDPIFELLDYNLHNSFLSLHYFTGFFSIILIIILVKSIFFTKGKLFYRSLLVVLLIRGFTDSLFFFNFNDIIIFYLLFLISDKKSKVVKKEVVF